MTKKTIVFDADDVLLEGAAFILQCAKEILGPDLKEVSKSFKLTERYGISPQDEAKVFKIFNEKMVYQKPLKGAQEVLTELEKYFNIVVVTAINKEGIQARKECFKLNKIPVHEVYATGVLKSKRDCLSTLKPLLFVDDRLKNLRDARHLNIYRSWICHEGEDQGLEECPSLFESKHSDLIHWFETVGKHFI